MLITQEKTKNPEDPRVVRTRALLVDALHALIGEKSFDAITVSEIASRATLNRVTFYAHFQDKYALLEYDMSSRIRAELDTALGPQLQLSEDALHALLRFVCTFLDKTESHCPPPRGQMEALVEKQLKTHIYERLMQGLAPYAAARPRAEAPTLSQTATVAAWALYGAAQQWTHQQPRQALDPFVQQVLPLVAANLAPYLPPKPSRSVPAAAGGRGPRALLSSPLRLALR